VAGKVIGEKTVAGQAIKFDVNVPASYVAWAGGKQVTGLLDGTPWNEPRELAVGTHEFIPGEKHAKLYILWSRAAELGFHPLDAEKSKSKKQAGGWEYYR
jgi:hypothetical protein